jgi:NAD(P)-dependent dehydrogenase (short-subunit alcohol dehydrogenase family)
VPGRLTGKTVVITGAASGQGRAAAILFAREGARLALCDVDVDGLKETDALATAGAGTDVMIERCDLGVIDEIKTFVDAVVARFTVIDVIYNNAGVMSRTSIEETTEDEWDRVNDINVKGPFFLVKYALPALRQSSAGSVINVASMSGLVAPRTGSTVYSASKGAVIALTRAQARDLAEDGIRVNCIAPGPIDTPMPGAGFATVPADQRRAVMNAAVSRNMIQRFGDAEEVATVALFLSTDDSSYITGTTIPVDGGWTAT